MINDSQRNSIKYYIVYLLWYTVFFALAYAAVFYMFAHGGKSFVWATDGMPFYIPSMYHFIETTKAAISDLFSGIWPTVLFDFTIGLGETATFRLEPLYWLSLLFSPDQTELAFDVILFVRIYLAGLSMSAFLFYFKNGRMASLVASLAYIGCGFCLYGGFRHTHFVVPMILLPPSILAIEEILRSKRRWYVCTIVVWLNLWCGYYFTYMNTIAMGCYFLIRFFCQKEGRTFQEFWKRVGLIVASYVLGVMMGCLTLVDTFASFLTSSRTETAVAAQQINYLTYGLTWPIQFFMSFMCAGYTPGKWLRLGFIPLVFAAVVALMSKKGKKELKVAVILGTLFCMIPAVGYVFGGFANINNRWCYIYAFVLTATLGFVLKDLVSLTKRQLRILCIASVPFLIGYACMILIDRKYRTFGEGAFVSLVLTLLVLLFLNSRKDRKWQKVLMLGVTVVTLWGSEYMEFSYNGGDLRSEFTDAGQVLTQIIDTPLAATQKIQDDSFYRAASSLARSDNQGASQVLDYNGTVHYDNVTKKTVSQFYEDLGLSSWSQVRMMGFDGRFILDTLSSVKYYLLEKGQNASIPYGYTKNTQEECNGKTYEIYENRLALPLGYTYESCITEEEWRQHDAAQRQEIMMQSAVVSDQEAMETLKVDEKELQITGQSIDITDIQAEYADVTNTGIYFHGRKTVPAQVTLTFDAPENCEVYLYFKNLHWDSGKARRMAYSCGEYANTYTVHGTKNIYETKQEMHIMNMGYHADKTTSCTISVSCDMDLQFDEIGIYCQPMENMEEYVAALKEDVLENVEMGRNLVKGTISLEEEKLLALTIPYTNGWTAYVDGEQVDLVKVNDMYMGLVLQPGEHIIELHYQMPGLALGLLVTSMGFVIFIIALIVRKKSGKKLKQ